MSYSKLLVLALCTVFCRAADTPDAKSLLTQSAGAMFSHTGGFRMENEMKVTMSGGGMNMTMRTKMSSSEGKLRVETEPIKSLTVSDGESMYMWVGAMNEYVKRSAPKSVGEMVSSVSGMSGFGDPGAMVSTAKIVRTEGIDFQSKSIECYVVESTLDNVPLPAPPGATMSGMMTSWIDKDRHITVKQLFDMTMKMGASAEPMKINMEQNLVSLDLSPIFGPDEFRFVVPEGAKQVDALPGMPASK